MRIPPGKLFHLVLLGPCAAIKFTSFRRFGQVQLLLLVLESSVVKTRNGITSSPEEVGRYLRYPVPPRYPPPLFC